MHACNMHVREVHAEETHAHETHANQMVACGMHARKEQINHKRLHLGGRFGTYSPP